VSGHKQKSTEVQWNIICTSLTAKSICAGGKPSSYRIFLNFSCHFERHNGIKAGLSLDLLSGKNRTLTVGNFVHGLAGANYVIIQGGEGDSNNEPHYFRFFVSGQSGCKLDGVEQHRLAILCMGRASARAARDETLCPFTPSGHHPLRRERAGEGYLCRRVPESRELLEL
jgi:hypothetical protein